MEMFLERERRLEVAGEVRDILRNAGGFGGYFFNIYPSYNKAGIQKCNYKFIGVKEDNLKEVEPYLKKNNVKYKVRKIGIRRTEYVVLMLYFDYKKKKGGA